MLVFTLARVLWSDYSAPTHRHQLSGPNNVDHRMGDGGGEETGLGFNFHSSVVQPPPFQLGYQCHCEYYDYDVSLQFAGMHLHHWAWQANNPEWTNDILNMGVCTRGPANELPVLFTAVLKLMADCCGYAHPANQLLMRDWSSLPINLPGTHLQELWGTAAGFEVIPYTIGNPLAISHFLVKRPLEWGICQPRPVVNFSKEVWARGTIGQMGWRAMAGSSDYAQRAQSPEAYVAIVYGAYALNVLAQMIDANDAPVITVQDCATSGRDSRVRVAPRPVGSTNIPCRHPYVPTMYGDVIQPRFGPSDGRLLDGS